MRPFLSGLAVLFALSLPALVLAGVLSLVGIAFGLPAGWAIALALFCFTWARNGWSAASGAIAPHSIRHNGQGAFALLHVLALLLAIAFAAFSLPHRLSQWWALLLPLIPVPMLLAQAALEATLNIVNPSGRRP
jgi:hypothetical protein